VQSGAPNPYTGPLISAKVDDNGNCQVNFNGAIYTAPPAIVLAFANWVTATFT
jgi:hypothetical protein